MISLPTDFAALLPAAIFYASFRCRFVCRRRAIRFAERPCYGYAAAAAYFRAYSHAAADADSHIAARCLSFQRLSFRRQPPAADALRFLAPLGRRYVRYIAASARAAHYSSSHCTLIKRCDDTADEIFQPLQAGPLDKPAASGMAAPPLQMRRFLHRLRWQASQLQLFSL